MSSQILSSPLNMASMAEFGKCWNAAHSSNVISLLQCVHVRVCECWEWHALTEHPHTCWLVVNRREMWQSKIFSFTPQMWSHDFDGDLEKSKTDKVPTLSVPPPPHRDRGGCEGWKRCVWCCRDERLIHIKERKENYIFSLKKKKKICDAEVTPHTHTTYLLGNYLRPVEPIETVSVSVFPSLSLAVSKLMCLWMKLCILSEWSDTECPV